MEPFDVLIEIAHRSHKAARPLPPRATAQVHWMGLGFSLLDHRLVVPMDEVAELIRVPFITAVPGVRNWLSGIANVRGRLMTLVDLSVYFGQPSTRSRAQRRIFAQEGEDYYYGFIVDESLGMQHFSRENHRPTADVALPAFRPYLRGSYVAGATSWPVFSLLALGREISETRIAI